MGNIRSADVSLFYSSYGPFYETSDDTDGTGSGGAEKVVLELTRQLRRRAHDVTVVSLMPEPPEERRAIPEGLSACGAKVIYLNVVKKAPWRLLSLFQGDSRGKTGCDPFPSDSSESSEPFCQSVDTETAGEYGSYCRAPSRKRAFLPTRRTHVFMVRRLHRCLESGCAFS